MDPLQLDVSGQRMGAAKVASKRNQEMEYLYNVHGMDTCSATCE